MREGTPMYRNFVLCALVAMGLGACASSGTLPVSAALECGPEGLGTSRTVILPRQAAAYGANQHAALPGLKKGEVVITFDDGPRAGSTPGVLKALADQCVKATFFMVGQAIDSEPAIARDVVAQGHTAAIHSYYHNNLTELTPEQQAQDLQRTADVFERTLGFKPAAYRFPFLAEAPASVDLLKAQNYTIMSIDLGIADWDPDMTTEILSQRLATELAKTGGGILLLHDGFDSTAEAMPALLKVLKDNGYKVVHVVWQ